MHCGERPTPHNLAEPPASGTGQVTEFCYVNGLFNPPDKLLLRHWIPSTTCVYHTFLLCDKQGDSRQAETGRLVCSWTHMWSFQGCCGHFLPPASSEGCAESKNFPALSSLVHSGVSLVYILTPLFCSFLQRIWGKPFFKEFKMPR